eukprot:CAMPEP_0183435402 /NCGR_PEP_ID=MMETSP0370-20130417/67897_1 /TAXON_ID=268820 /ORGANISM="Peridinium aciculiferum, Strain PAER-2" /LENGTH=219 /DNA_ID=CAMNT_0025622487 /DNA_START=69 /DNA_END=726 /DNA_ORIENTATION=+
MCELKVAKFASVRSVVNGLRCRSAVLDAERLHQGASLLRQILASAPIHGHVFTATGDVAQGGIGLHVRCREEEEGALAAHFGAPQVVHVRRKVLQERVAGEGEVGPGALAVESVEQKHLLRGNRGGVLVHHILPRLLGEHPHGATVLVQAHQAFHSLGMGQVVFVPGNLRAGGATTEAQARRPTNTTTSFILRHNPPMHDTTGRSGRVRFGRGGRNDLS